MQHAASAITAPDTDQLPVYWQFHEAVTRAQLTEWLPTGRHLLVDVSGPRGPGAELAATAGHTVLRVIEPGREGPPPRARSQQGRIFQVIADSSQLTFLGDGCADGVIADDRALSVHLAAEAMIAEIARVLRPSLAGAVQHAHNGVPGLGGQFGAGCARAGYVDQQVPAGGQPLGQLGTGHRLVELPVNRELIGVRRGDRAGRMLHGPRLLTRRPSRAGTGRQILQDRRCHRAPRCYLPVRVVLKLASSPVAE